MRQTPSSSAAVGRLPREEGAMVVHRHLVEAVTRDIGNVNTRAPLGYSPRYTRPISRSSIDDLEDVVEALPRRIQIAQQDVLAGLQRALIAVLHLDLSRLLRAWMRPSVSLVMPV